MARTVDSPSWSALEVLIYCAIWPVLVWISVEDPGMTWFNHHMSRDVSRAIDWLAGQPRFYGPEIATDVGQGLPGPSYYFYLAPFWLVAGSVPLMLALKQLSTLAIMAWAWLEFRRSLGRVAALILLLLFGLAPFFVIIGRTAWNPSVIVPCNLVLIILTYRYCMDNTRRWTCYAIFLVSAIGIQGHYAVLMSFLACLFVLLINTRPRSRLVLPTVLFGLYHAVAAHVGQRGGNTPMTFAEGIAGRGFTTDSLSNLFVRIGEHLHLATGAEGGYFTFTFLFRVAEALDQTTAGWIYEFGSYGVVYIALFVLSLFAILGALVAYRGRFAKLHVLEQLALVWLFFDGLYLGAYTESNDPIPSRYLLALYPMQFLIIAMGVRRLRLWLESPRLQALPVPGRALGAAVAALAVALSGVAFAGNAYFLDWSYQLMRHSGRTYYGSNESYEVPLEQKMEILALGRELSGENHDLFQFLHGPVTERVRLYEHHSGYVERYGALEHALRLDPPARKMGRKQHLFVRSLQWNELRQHYQEGRSELPYEIETLPESALPRDLEILYFDKAGERVASRSLDVHEQLITPFDSLSDEERSRARKLTMRFKIDARGRPHLRAYYDGPKPYFPTFQLVGHPRERPSQPIAFHQGGMASAREVGPRATSARRSRTRRIGLRISADDRKFPSRRYLRHTRWEAPRAF